MTIEPGGVVIFDGVNAMAMFFWKGEQFGNFSDQAKAKFAGLPIVPASFHGASDRPAILLEDAAALNDLGCQVFYYFNATTVLETDALLDTFLGHEWFLKYNGNFVVKRRLVGDRKRVRFLYDWTNPDLREWLVEHLVDYVRNQYPFFYGVAPDSVNLFSPNMPLRMWVDGIPTDDKFLFGDRFDWRFGHEYNAGLRSFMKALKDLGIPVIANAANDRWQWMRNQSIYPCIGGHIHHERFALNGDGERLSEREILDNYAWTRQFELAAYSSNISKDVWPNLDELARVEAARFALALFLIHYRHGDLFHFGPYHEPDSWPLMFDADDFVWSVPGSNVSYRDGLLSRSFGSRYVAVNIGSAPVRLDPAGYSLDPGRAVFYF